MCVSLYVCNGPGDLGCLAGGGCIQVYNVVVSADTPPVSVVPLCASGEDVGGVHTGGDNGDIVVAWDLFLPWVTVECN